MSINGFICWSEKVLLTATIVLELVLEFFSILDFILLNDYHFLSKGTIVEIKRILRLDE